MPVSQSSPAPSGSAATTRSAPRWIGVSAVVAASVSAVAFVGPMAGAAPEDDATVYTPIAPCRLVDTRPEFQIGPRDTKLGADETHRQQVTGIVGNCDIPSDASGVSLNVTAVDQTAPSYMTLFPFGGSVPNVSNLNYVPGGAPIPNKVDVKLSDDGALGVYNLAGTVHLVIDVSGYYSNTWMQDVIDSLAGKADIGDSYLKAETYTQAEIDAALADKADLDDIVGIGDVYLKSETYSQAQIDAALADKADSSDVYTKSEADARFMGSDPVLVVHQATSTIQSTVGLLGIDILGATISAVDDAIVELTGPPTTDDPVDYRLDAVDLCIDDLLLGARIDSATVSIRDGLGGVTQVEDTTDRTTAGCFAIDVSAAGDGVAYVVELDVVGLLGTELLGSVRVTSLETTWSPVVI